MQADEAASDPAIYPICDGDKNEDGWKLFGTIKSKQIGAIFHNITLIAQIQADTRWPIVSRYYVIFFVDVTTFSLSRKNIHKCYTCKMKSRDNLRFIGDV